MPNSASSPCSGLPPSDVVRLAHPGRAGRHGRDAEVHSLARAVEWHSEFRVPVGGDRTVLFRRPRRRRVGKRGGDPLSSDGSLEDAAGSWYTGLAAPGPLPQNN